MHSIVARALEGSQQLSVFMYTLGMMKVKTFMYIPVVMNSAL